jgi:hypothetical protein
MYRKKAYMNNKIFTKLPAVEQCRSLMQSMAVMDAILSPNWEYRYYSYDTLWGKDEIMASMRGSDGEHYFALFREGNLIIKGLEQGYPMLYKRFEQENLKAAAEALLPQEFKDFLFEPAFLPEETSFCIWKIGEKEWESITEPKDGELALLERILGGAFAYASWAEDYYETALKVTELERFFQGEPLTKDICLSWNPKLDWTEFCSEIASMGIQIEL